MNKIITAIIFISGLPVMGHASDNSRRVMRYEAEGHVYYRLEGFVPHSEIAFYSDVSGGRCLRTIATDGTGQLQFQADPGFTPSFVLNVKTQQDHTGDGMVTFIGEKAFLIDHIAAEQHDNTITLTWDAAVASTGDYEFTIMRSKDNITYTPVAIVPAGSTALSGYHYTDQDGLGFYKIQVSGIKSNIKYLSKPLEVGVHSFKVYPTIAEDHIRVVYNGDVKQAGYTIMDIQGRTVDKGIILASPATISIKNLATGSYLLHIESNNGKQVKPVRFVKK